jgi:hypothetical protein
MLYGLNDLSSLGDAQQCVSTEQHQMISEIRKNIFDVEMEVNWS